MSEEFRFMRSVASLLLMLIASATVVAQDPTDVLVVGKNGYSILTQDANGNPVLIPSSARFKQVIVLGVPTPGPTPTPDVPVPVLTPRALLVRTSASRATGDPARDETATKLAILCEELAKRAGKDIKGN